MNEWVNEQTQEQQRKKQEERDANKRYELHYFYCIGINILLNMFQDMMT